MARGATRSAEHSSSDDELELGVSDERELEIEIEREIEDFGNN